MLILDDIIAAPFKGLLWIVKKISETAKAELESRKQRTTTELSELYMLLDTEKITEEEFDARERVLLDELDRVNKLLEGGTGEEHEEGEPSGEARTEAGTEEERGAGAKAT
jgi:transcription elongation factor